MLPAVLSVQVEALLPGGGTAIGPDQLLLCIIHRKVRPCLRAASQAGLEVALLPAQVSLRST